MPQPKEEEEAKEKTLENAVLSTVWNLIHG